MWQHIWGNEHYIVTCVTQDRYMWISWAHMRSHANMYVARQIYVEFLSTYIITYINICNSIYETNMYVHLYGSIIWTYIMHTWHTYVHICCIYAPYRFFPYGTGVTSGHCSKTAHRLTGSDRQKHCVAIQISAINAKMPFIEPNTEHDICTKQPRCESGMHKLCRLESASGDGFPLQKF